MREMATERRSETGSRRTCFSFAAIRSKVRKATIFSRPALTPVMPALVTSSRPALDAARYHTQVEFDRTYRSIRRTAAYRGKSLLFIAGLNVDVSPPAGMPFR